VVWTLGSKSNDFKDVTRQGKALDFSWQHDARAVNGQDGTLHITMFDNHGRGSSVGQCSMSGSCSRGRVIALDEKRGTASLIRDYGAPERLESPSMGGFQMLSNGNALVGWGQQPVLTEHTPDGSAVLDVQFGILPQKIGSPQSSYRAAKATWVGYPPWGPSIAASTDGKKVYVSWNGATEVARWAVVSLSLSACLHDNFELTDGFSTPPTMRKTLPVGAAVRILSGEMDSRRKYPSTIPPNTAISDSKLSTRPVRSLVQLMVSVCDRDARSRCRVLADETWVEQHRTEPCVPMIHLCKMIQNSAPRLGPCPPRSESDVYLGFHIAKMIQQGHIQS
jgi:hypothetical protein